MLFSQLAEHRGRARVSEGKQRVDSGTRRRQRPLPYAGAQHKESEP